MVLSTDSPRPLAHLPGPHSHGSPHRQPRQGYGNLAACGLPGCPYPRRSRSRRSTPSFLQLDPVDTDEPAFDTASHEDTNLTIVGCAHSFTLVASLGSIGCHPLLQCPKLCRRNHMDLRPGHIGLVRRELLHLK